MDEPDIVAVAISALIDDRKLIQKLSYIQKIMSTERLAFVTRFPRDKLCSSTTDWAMHIRNGSDGATLTVPFRWYGIRKPSLIDAFESVRQTRELKRSQDNEQD